MLFFESKSEFFKKTFRQKMSQRIKDERTLLSSKVSGKVPKMEVLYFIRPFLGVGFPLFT